MDERAESDENEGAFEPTGSVETNVRIILICI